MAATRSSKKPLACLVGLVLIDLISKIAACTMLSTLTPEQSGDLHFVLTVNISGFGTAANRLIGETGNEGTLTGFAIMYALFAFYLLLLTYLSRLQPKIIVTGVIFIWIGIAAAMKAHLIPQLGREQAGIVLHLAVVLLWCTIWWLARSPWWKAGVTLCAAAGIGNTLSMFYPPYGVVDFIWWGLLNRTVGFQVFNLADLMWLLGTGALFVAACYSVIRKVRSNNTLHSTSTPPLHSDVHTGGHQR